MKLTPQQTKDFDSYCNRLVQEEIEPPNETIKFLLSRYKDAKAEAKVVEGNLDNFQHRLDHLHGSVNAYAEDINTLVRKFLFEDIVHGDSEEKAPEEPAPVRH